MAYPGVDSDGSARELAPETVPKLDSRDDSPFQLNSELRGRFTFSNTSTLPHLTNLKVASKR